MLRTPIPRAAGQSNAALDVLAERRRQVEIEGWTAEHDDAHTQSEMAMAAACYCTSPDAQAGIRDSWPWSPEWWKPKDRRSNLVRAGALILAEIERLDRVASSEAPWRTCEFCGCYTNARMRACCIKGNSADHARASDRYPKGQDPSGLGGEAVERGPQDALKSQQLDELKAELRDPEKARAFLRSVGIVGEDGQLTERFGGGSQGNRQSGSGTPVVLYGGNLIRAILSDPDPETPPKI